MDDTRGRLWPYLVTPTIHAMLVALVAGTFWDPYLPVNEADANIGAAFVLLVLAVLASPWSMAIEVWWPALGTTEMVALYTTGAAVNVVLHGCLMLALWGRSASGT